MEEELLVEYAAGALGRAGALLVATQCAMNPRAYERVRYLEAVAGAVLDQAGEAPAAREALEAIEARLAHADRNGDEPPRINHRVAPEFADMPAPLRAALADEPDGARWRMVMPGMSERVLPHLSDDSASAKLIRLKAGRAIPEHGHEGREITLVLDGAYHDDFGVYEPGAVSVVDDSVEHRPTVSPDRDCICLAVQEGRLIVRRPVRELVRYFFG